MPDGQPRPGSAGPFYDEGDELAAAADGGGERGVAPVRGVISPKAVDESVALEPVAGSQLVGLGGFAVELASAGGSGIGRAS